jgi:hypothetical protein
LLDTTNTNPDPNAKAEPGSDYEADGQDYGEPDADVASDIGRN